MSGADKARSGEPSEVELLLPWYAAGTLDPAAMREIEAAIAGDPELADRYEWARAEFAQETAIGDGAGAPSPNDVRTLFAKIDALPARRSQSTFNLGDRIAEFLASLSPRTLGWSAAAAALAIVLQAAVLGGIAIHDKAPGNYQSASVPSATPGNGSYVLIRFAPAATAADISTFLADNNLSIVSGPSGGQLYQVRIAPAKLAPEELSREVAKLQSNKVVGFIAAVQ